MFPEGFEPVIPASNRPQTHSLGRAISGIGEVEVQLHDFLYLVPGGSGWLHALAALSREAITRYRLRGRWGTEMLWPFEKAKPVDSAGNRMRLLDCLPAACPLYRLSNLYPTHTRVHKYRLNFIVLIRSIYRFRGQAHLNWRLELWSFVQLLRPAELTSVRTRDKWMSWETCSI
jgi:hypothetical protein